MEVIKFFCLGTIIGLLIAISLDTSKIVKLVEQNTQEIKKVNEGFEMINKPLGKAINKEYVK